MIKRAAPRVLLMSAMLNEGKLAIFMKSITNPWRILSRRLEKVPAMMRVRAVFTKGAFEYFVLKSIMMKIMKVM